MKMLRKYGCIIAGPFIIIVLVVTVIRIGIPGFGQSTREVCEASSQETSPSSSRMIFYNGIILTMDDAQPPGGGCGASSQETPPSSSRMIFSNGTIPPMDDPQPQAQAIAKGRSYCG